MRPTQRKSVLLATALVGAATALAATPATGPLRVSKENPRYFADGNGKVVYLTGSHTWNSLQDVTGDCWFLPNLISAQGFDAYLDFLASHQHNFIRLWIVEHTWQDNSGARISPHPWPRSGQGNALDGKPRFDLSKYDPVYFERLRSRVIAAGDRGVYVSVMLFGGMWGTEHPGTWKGHPFNGANNINGIDGDSDHDGTGNEIYTCRIPEVLAIQKATAAKVVETLNDLDNVLYEVANEVREHSIAWQYEIINHVKAVEAAKPKQHPVGMTGHNSIPHDDLVNSPADWISPSNSGGNYRDNPPPADGRPVILIDTDHLWGEGGDPRWVWKSFTRGLHPLWMERLKLGPGDLPQAENIRKAMGYTRRFAERMNLAETMPRNDLASTGYCLASPGKEYLVYLSTAGTSFAVNLRAGTYDYEWFDPTVGAAVGGGSLTVAGGECSFSIPFSGEAVLYIKRNESGPRAPVNQPIPLWFPKAQPLPPPRGEVILASTVDELFAAVERIRPGGTILLADGHYRLPRVIILQGKKDITIRSAAGDPAKVSLSGRGWDSEAKGDDILHIGRCEGVTIADITFTDCRSYGIKVEAENEPKDIHIYNCRFRDIGVRAIKGSAGQDPNVRAAKGSVRYCYFENTKVPSADWLFGGDYIAAIDMMALEDWVFSDNVVRNVKGRNGGGRAAIFIWVRSRRVVVERNLIVNCDRGVAFGNPGQSTANVAAERLVYVSDGIIRNNFIVDGPDCGIELWHAERIKVCNNTIWRPEQNWSRGIRIGTGTSHTEIVNNLVHGEIQFDGGQAELRQNFCGRLDGYFVDPPSGNLTLTSAASGAIDQGVSVPEVTDDIRQRPRSGRIDLGAWEFVNEKKTQESTPLSPRTERFTKIETLAVGEFFVDLCQCEDGVFGLGEVHHGTLPLRRADTLITWQVAGRFPAFGRRDGLTIRLRDPSATLLFATEARDCAGTSFMGLRMRFQTERGPIVEAASWELSGSTRGLSYFGGYRGWHAPPQWLQADAVPKTNPKLLPSLLQGTGFQFQYGEAGALLHFHTTPGDRLRNVSRGETLEFETTFNGPANVTRYIFITTASDSRIKLFRAGCRPQPLYPVPALFRHLEKESRSHHMVGGWRSEWRTAHGAESHYPERV